MKKEFEIFQEVAGVLYYLTFFPFFKVYLRKDVVVYFLFMEEQNLRKIFISMMRTPGRKRTREIHIGKVPLGGKYPVRIQSMAGSPTSDTAACVEESIRIIRAGADYIRFTAQNTKEAGNLADIRDHLRRRGYYTPIIADVHFNPKIAETAARIVEKVRINPGNFARIVPPGKGMDTEKEEACYIEQIREQLVPLLNICKKHHTALRLGVNHGSLSKRILEKYGDTPQGMVISAMEYLRICKEENFHEVVLSMKSSNTRVMVHAYRLLVATMAVEGELYPLHLGITEAGEGEDGRIRSAAGIGALLADGLGDTIRVSLTEPSEKEVPVARQLVHYFSWEKEQAPEVKIPASFDPFEYMPAQETMTVAGFPKMPVVVSTGMYDSQQAPRPDFVVRENAEPRMLFSSGKRLPFIKVLLDDEGIQDIKRWQENNPATVVVVEAGERDSVRKIRTFFFRLQEEGIRFPVILKKTYHSETTEQFWIEAAAEMGPLFLDGLGNGLWLEYVKDKAEERREKKEGGVKWGKGDEKKGDLERPDVAVETAFGILQASRVRFSRPEYISCPSCGRTLFDIRKVTAEIRKRTSHLKGIKIAVMGCIVNGPGEMADADYGYVGSGKDRITLYRNRKIVKRNIPAKDAVDELIKLIKDNGGWLA